jgi:hypothetical protein
MNQPHAFTWRHCEAEIILQCVRWYVRDALSSRDLEERMAERGRAGDHPTFSRSRPAGRCGAGEALPSASESLQRLLFIPFSAWPPSP